MDIISLLLLLLSNKSRTTKSDFLDISALWGWSMTYGKYGAYFLKQATYLTIIVILWNKQFCSENSQSKCVGMNTPLVTSVMDKEGGWLLKLLPIIRFCSPINKNQCRLFLCFSLLMFDGHLEMSKLFPIISDVFRSFVPDVPCTLFAMSWCVHSGILLDLLSSLLLRRTHLIPTFGTRKYTEMKV